MNEIIQAILFTVVMLATLCAYVFCVRYVLPKFVIKRGYYIKDNLGRGLKKYVSDNGRALLFEPHPSIRKYIKQYALVCDGGNKYIQCYVDRGANRMIYSVIMLDRNDTVLDVIEVEEVTAKRTLTQPVYLHPDTSYVALILGSVNREQLPNSPVSYYTRKSIVAFGFITAAITFVASLIFSLSFANVMGGLGVVLKVSGGIFALTSMIAAVAAGVLSAVLLLMDCAKKNVRVIR